MFMIKQEEFWGKIFSNKKLNKNESFDHGVQYISPKSIQFKKFIKI